MFLLVFTNVCVCFLINLEKGCHYFCKTNGHCQGPEKLVLIPSYYTYMLYKYLFNKKN